MNPSVLRHVCGLVLMASYAVYKYQLGMQSWNFGYAVQIVVIVMLAAIIPFYITTWCADPLDRSRRIVIMVIFPTVLSIAGYGMFYLAYIRPVFTSISAVEVMQGGLQPGLAITVLLLVLEWLAPIRYVPDSRDQPTSSPDN